MTAGVAVGIGVFTGAGVTVAAGVGVAVGRGCRRRCRRRGRSRASQGKALGVEALDEAVGTVDPGAVAVGEGGPVVGLAPDQQAAGGLLEAVAVVAVVLVLQALTDNLVADEIAERLAKPSTNWHSAAAMEVGMSR